MSFSVYILHSSFLRQLYIRLLCVMHTRAKILAKPMIIAYQAYGSVDSLAGLGTEWVRSSRDDTDVVCRWPRS